MEEESKVQDPLEARWRWPVGLLLVVGLGSVMALKEPVPSGWLAYGVLVLGLAWIGQAVIPFRWIRSSLIITLLTAVTLLLMEEPMPGNFGMGILVLGSLLVARRVLIYAALLWLPLDLYSRWAGNGEADLWITLLVLIYLLVIYFFKGELNYWQNRSQEERRLYAVSERRLQNQNTHLENLGRMVSHNLRAPLQGVKMLIKMLPEVDPAERVELRQQMTGATEEVLSMVKQLSSMLKQHAEAREQTEELSLSEIWEATKSQLQGLITSSGAVLDADFSELSKLKFPRIYLESIFLNLTSNALKYPQEGQSPVLKVRSFQDGDLAIIEFTDQGRGINMEEEGQQLFEWHRPGDQREESLGMGLFMTKNQVEMLGGKLMVDSQVGKGSTFWIQIPVDY